MSRKMFAVPCLLAALAGGASALADHCSPVFDLSLGTPGPVADFSNFVNAFRATDVVTPGSNVLYVGGSFDTIGGVAGTSGISVWNGSTFSPLATGVHRIDLDFDTMEPNYSTPSVNVILPFNGALYVGGQFDGTDGGVVSRGIIRWNGTAWESLNDKHVDVLSYVVNGLAVYQGSLYAAGQFPDMGTSTARGIARYLPDTNDWEEVDGGVPNLAGINITDMLVFNDGSGEKLYVCGNFTTIGSAANPATKHIARFNGTTWEPVGAGYISSGASAFPRDMLVFDDGTGPALYVAGGLAVADPAIVLSSINKWDGKSWKAVEGFTDDFNVTAATVNSMGLYNDGTGTTIYAQVRFFGASIGARQVLARLENGRFHELPNTSLGANSIFEMYQHNDGSGSALFVGGSFTEVNGVAANRIAKITDCAGSGGSNPCPADFNESGTITVQDIFDFLAAYFAGCP